MSKTEGPKVALAMVVRAADDEAPLLEQCLKTIHRHVDGIFLQLNSPPGVPISKKVRQVAEKYTNHIITKEWANNFVKARTENFAQVPKSYDWILWLDTDDIVVHPEKIRQVVAEATKLTMGIYACYDYGHDEFGNVTVSHWNVRLVRNNNAFEWKSSFEDSKVTVHEHLAATRVFGSAATHDFKVSHTADLTRQSYSLQRNVLMLEQMFDAQTKRGQVDPRVLYYLGTHYFDLARYDEVIELLSHYLKMSGWSEERSQAHCFVGRIFKVRRQLAMARTAFLMALGEDPHNNDACLELGLIEFQGQRYNQALTWLRRADSKKEIYTLVQFHRQYELYRLMADTLVAMGGKHLDEALRYADKALKLRPLDPEAVEARDKIYELVELKKDTRAVARIIRKLNTDNEKTKIASLLPSLPDSLQDSPVVMGARQEFVTPVKWPKKSIAIFVGAGPHGIWGPWSLKDGIGGSEEAVIQMSKELTSLGWHVVVFSTPGDRHGVIKGYGTWKHYWEFNYNDEYDVVIAWRSPGFFQHGIKARKKYVWMHDVMTPGEFAPEVLETIDKVIFLSKYHRSLFPMVPEKKVFYSGNGIDPKAFEAVEKRKLKRDPHRMIYMSSHVRGLDKLYQIWPEVKRAVPDASLDVYYGWESYIAIEKDNPERMAWMAKMQAWAESLDGVTDHGKIGHTQIIEEIFKAGVWAYPTPFPEIYCITAVKAQAGGATPITVTFGALDEMVAYGVKIPIASDPKNRELSKWTKFDLERYKEALIEALKKPELYAKERPAMMKWARSHSWAATAKGWDKELK